MSKKHKRKNPAPGASKYITISVAEYVCLVKAATMLEILVNDPSYDRKSLDAVLNAAQHIGRIEGGGQA